MTKDTNPFNEGKFAKWTFVNKNRNPYNIGTASHKQWNLGYEHECANPTKTSYPFNKYQLADRMRNCMHIADEFLVGLDVYRMVHGTGGGFAINVNDGQLPLKKLDSDPEPALYNVIYYQCTPVSAKKAQELRFSFRAAKPEFGIEPIVLVQIVRES